MNKVKILAVAIISLASTAFAGGSLWNFNDGSDSLFSTTNCGDYCSQVKTPGAVFCWKGTGAAPRPADSVRVDKDGDTIPRWGSPCYAKTGGWWFGYADNGGKVKDAVSNKAVFKAASCNPMPKDPTPAQSEGTIAIEKYISANQNLDWKSLTVPAFPQTGGNDKHYLVKNYGMGNATDGLDVIFDNPAGTDRDPSVSAIGFNWRGKEECGGKDWEGRFTENIREKGAGLCIRYKADKAGVDVELGWNEALYEYKTWINKLPATNDAWKTVNIKWETFGLSYVSDEEETHPLETALTQAEALKFALKTKGAAETIHFQLREVGWHGTCSGTADELPPYVTGSTPPTDPDPIIGGKAVSAYKFSINGRTLSANFAGAVQIVNLQGKVVAKKTLAANESLSLASLPAGIYMVRSTTAGIVQKVILK